MCECLRLARNILRPSPWWFLPLTLSSLTCRATNRPKLLRLYVNVRLHLVSVPPSAPTRDLNR